MTMSPLGSGSDQKNMFSSVVSVLSNGRTLLVLIVLLLCYTLYHLFPSETSAQYDEIWRKYHHLENPPQRTSCDIPIATNGVQQKSYKVGILVLFEVAGDDKLLTETMWSNELMDKVIRNRQQYADIYGHKIIKGNDYIDHSRPVAWSKLKAIGANLKDYDYIMLLDMDAVIMNPSVDVSSYIAAAGENDFILTNDWNGLNSGAMLVKNTQFAQDFLDLAWKVGGPLTLAKDPTTNRGYPFQYEQRSFHYLLDTDRWHVRPFPRYNGSETDIEELKPQNIKKHFSFLPQCSLNSYHLQPIDIHAQKEKYLQVVDIEHAQFVPGDFVIHFAGKKGVEKENLLRQYLTLADEKFQMFKHHAKSEE